MNTPLRRTQSALVAVATGLGMAIVAEARQPATAEAAAPDVTIGQLRTMFGAQVATKSRVAANLPTLNKEMRAAGITSPQQRAAFLTTLVHESRLDPSASEVGVRARYKGRGYIQLTGSWNYGAASRAVGVNLRSNPSAAAHPRHSTKIATWYWTTLRPGTNKAAQNFDMGRVSRNVGYAASYREDAERCRDFKKAYKVLSGRTAPGSTRCYRH